jgi:hypothetical protein
MTHHRSRVLQFVIDVDDLDRGVAFWSAALDATEEPLSEPESTDPVFARRIVDGSVLRVSGGSRAVMMWRLSAAAWCSMVVVAGRRGGYRL